MIWLKGICPKRVRFLGKTFFNRLIKQIIHALGVIFSTTQLRHEVVQQARPAHQIHPG